MRQSVRYVGETTITPDAVLEGFAGLGGARASSWASSRVWDPNRLYCQVRGNEFHAAYGGGASGTALSVSGYVSERAGLTVVRAHVALGMLPYWTAPGAGVVAVLLGLASLLAWVILPRGEVPAIAGAVISALLIAYFATQKLRLEDALSTLSEAVGGIVWRRARSAA